MTRSSHSLFCSTLYRVLPDSQAGSLGCLRIIDESGEDYLYSADRFVLVELPETIRAQLLAAVEP